jgi:hypothetical protein
MKFSLISDCYLDERMPEKSLVISHHDEDYWEGKLLFDLVSKEKRMSFETLRFLASNGYLAGEDHASKIMGY